MIDPNVNNLALAYPRFTKIPFPPYRFVPGAHPHPVASPQGHSYLPPGATEPPVPFHPPERWRESEAYLFGCDLYNHGFWWEAHEAWEGLWHVVPNPSPQRNFLQGIIQVGAGHLQAFLGKPDGVNRLRETSRRHLDITLEAVANRLFMGVQLRDWVKKVDAYWDVVLSSDPPRHHVVRYPYLALGSE